VEQPFDVLRGRRPLRATTETGPERIQKSPQALQQRPGRGLIHARQRRDFARSVQALRGAHAPREGDKVVLAVIPRIERSAAMSSECSTDVAKNKTGHVGSSDAMASRIVLLRMS